MAVHQVAAVRLKTNRKKKNPKKQETEGKKQETERKKQERERKKQETEGKKQETERKKQETERKKQDSRKKDTKSNEKRAEVKAVARGEVKQRRTTKKSVGSTAQVAKATERVGRAASVGQRAKQASVVGKVTIDTIDRNVIEFSVKKGNYNIEAITHFKIRGDRLFLDQLHIEGAAAGKIGRNALWEMAKNLGKHYNVKEVIIQGGRRTTGKYKGRMPSQVIVKIE
jgi:hypothetical protein